MSKFRDPVARTAEQIGVEIARGNRQLDFNEYTPEIARAVLDETSVRVCGQMASLLEKHPNNLPLVIKRVLTQGFPDGVSDAIAVLSDYEDLNVQIAMSTGYFNETHLRDELVDDSEKADTLVGRCKEQVGRGGKAYFVPFAPIKSIVDVDFSNIGHKPRRILNGFIVPKIFERVMFKYQEQHYNVDADGNFTPVTYASAEEVAEPAPVLEEAVDEPVARNRWGMVKIIGTAAAATVAIAAATLMKDDSDVSTAAVAMIPTPVFAPPEPDPEPEPVVEEPKPTLDDLFPGANVAAGDGSLKIAPHRGSLDNYAQFVFNKAVLEDSDVFSLFWKRIQTGEEYFKAEYDGAPGFNERATLKVCMEVTASPDGTKERNEVLAKERTGIMECQIETLAKAYGLKKENIEVVTTTTPEYITQDAKKTLMGYALEKGFTELQPFIDQYNESGPHSETEIGKKTQAVLGTLRGGFIRSVELGYKSE